MSDSGTEVKGSFPPANAEAARVDFPATSAEAALDDLKERDREQQVARSAWAEHVRQLWGPEPPYEQQPEDRSGAVFGSLFYSWMGRYIFQAAREELTEAGLPRPTRAYRAYNAGTRLSAQMQTQQLRRHAWDGYVGARVRVRWDAASDGVLRWVGTVQQYGTPRQLYAGVEWRVAPAQREVGVVGRWLLCRRGEAPESGPGAFHRGDVDGEHLFDLADDDTVATCERVEDVVFRLGTAADAHEAAAERALRCELPPSVREPPRSIQVWWTIWVLFRANLLPLVFLGVLGDACRLLQPLLLKWFVSYLTDVASGKSGDDYGSDSSDTSSAGGAAFYRYLGPPTAWQRGALLAFCMFGAMVSGTVAFNKRLHVRRRCSLQVRNALSVLLFEKVFTMSAKATHHPAYNAGRLANIMSSDVDNVGSFITMFWSIVSAPYMLAVAFYQLYLLLGNSVFVGGIVVAVFAPLQGLVMKGLYKHFKERSAATDRRIKATTELFSGIRVIKFMSWEPSFISNIEAIRKDELHCLKQIQKAFMAIFFLFNAAPGFVIASVFFTFGVSGHVLTPSIVFPAISLFNLLTGFVTMLPFALQTLSKLLVSLRRINLLFNAADDLVPLVEDINDLRDDDASGKTDPAGHSSRALAESTAAAFVHAELSTYVAEELQQPGNGAATPSAAPAAPQSSDAAADTAEGRPAHAKLQFKEDAVYVLRTKALLTDVDLRIPRGRLTVVLGPTGSGKSTLLDSLIGALAVTRGRVACSRSVAYVPQQPWIMSATLRDNVVFFGAADAAAFERAVASSQLAADLALLADGAETEIGERGINLSGGQKARVSLARAVYADRDVYVLDDPLSALDAHVGERVMRECVCGALARKTRVLATHQVSAAAYADYVVLLQDGRVAFQGTYAAYSVYCDINAELPLSSAAPSPEETKLPSDLIDASSPVVGRRLTSAACVEASDDDEDDATVSVQTAVSHKTAKNEGGFKAPAKLIEAEEMAEGSVTRDVYLRYMRACAGMRVWWMLVALYVGTEVFIVSSRVWLSFWTSKRFSGMSDAAYLYLYLTLVITGIVAHPIRRLCAYPVLRHGCRTIHDELLRSISSGTMAFFDTTPLGRIVNRFSKDLNMIDDRQQESIIEVLELMCDLVSYLSVVLVTEPFVILPVIPCAYLYYRLSLFFTAANRTIRRHGNVSNAPVLALLNTVLTGRWTIEAYGCAKDMMKDAFSRMDLVFSCSFLQETGQQWLAVRVGMLTNVIVCSAAFFGVVTINIASAATAKSRVGLLSLSITLATQISFMLYMAIEKAADLEANMNAMERITHYTDNIEHEDTQQDIAVAVHVHAAQLRRLMDRAVEVTIEDGGDAKDLSAELSPMTPAPHGVSGIAATSPASGTAHAGSLAFEHVDMRYRPGLPLVLRDVCFAIAPGQKVGVVGRTGSGKSTLLLAFLRLVEVCGGRMLVCGRDARDYGVRELRQLFSMIPQDPLLFDGTVRSNVDPFGACGDAAVWAALRQVGMEERVRGEAGGLDGRVQEGGSNFSVGQRQLLCLARALLKRGSAFLLMDEATANVDPALDRQIQRTVQQTFRDYTVVTIAHRLHTVASYDMILVMDGGRAVEFGAPRVLLEQGGSVFGQLVRSLSKSAQQAFRVALDEVKASC